MDPFESKHRAQRMLDREDAHWQQWRIKHPIIDTLLSIAAGAFIVGLLLWVIFT